MANNEFITEIGTVDKIKNGLFYVKLSKSEKCEGCKVCDFGKNNYITVPSLSEIDCSVGDSVVLRAPIKKTYLSSLIMYLMPIVIMIACAIIVYNVTHNDLHVLIACAVSLLVSFGLIFILDKAVRSKKNMPLIVRNLTKSNTTEG